MQYLTITISESLGFLFEKLFGELDPLLYALIAFITLDYITGVILAIHSKTLSSKFGCKGIARKAMMIAMVSVGHIVDQYVLVSGSAMRSMISIFYISNEPISVLENANALGLPLPAKLRDVFDKLKNK